jgi:hypothetical protein
MACRNHEVNEKYMKYFGEIPLREPILVVLWSKA